MTEIGRRVTEIGETLWPGNAAILIPEHLEPGKKFILGIPKFDMFLPRRAKFCPFSCMVSLCFERWATAADTLRPEPTCISERYVWWMRVQRSFSLRG